MKKWIGIGGWLFALVFVGCFDSGTGTSTTDAAVSDASACSDHQAMCSDACVDLQSDLAHCGACEASCETSEPNTVALCEAGSCGSQCAQGWVDADGDASNGCELECTPTNDGVEVCDGRDNDCDGQVDGPDAENVETWYADADADGYGDDGETVVACERPDGYIEDGGDCDDEDSGVYATVEGYRDDDADGWTRGEVVAHCTDGTLPDGFIDEENGEDCDDTDPEVNPAADEQCDDGIDNDCNGQIDDREAVDATIWYVDCDGDGFAAETNDSRASCERPTDAPSVCDSSAAGWSDLRPTGGSSTDCDDGVAEAFPGQEDWFDRPMGDDPSSQSLVDWDYNCSGEINVRWDGSNAFCQRADNGVSCDGTAGWVNDVKSCGTGGDYQQCSMVQTCNQGICSPICDSSVVQKTQECR